MKKMLLIALLLNGCLMVAAEDIAVPQQLQQFLHEIDVHMNLAQQKIILLKQLAEASTNPGEIRSLNAEEDKTIDYVKLLEKIKSKSSSMNLEEMQEKLNQLDEYYLSN
jgi:hypothetical protein